MNDSKLIAKFMGVALDTEKLKYHKSWDWLMPVIQKIMDISFQEEGDVDSFYSIRDCIPDIGYTYKKVVEFIKDMNDAEETEVE